ncbi:MAG: hypothetical protein D6698_13205 [Gammaproteobacteria bacterium]|nr:MAG: hypothetical protein D6698_13205 [Gammaproteobacteria bacterium]
MSKLQPVNWTFALLKQNPFPTTPPRHPEEAVWAGFTRLKKQFDSLFLEALTTSRTQVVLNRGEYGSGKTHAAIYFRRSDRLPAPEGKNVRDTWIFYIQTPKEPEQADRLLYRNFIEAVRFGQLRSVVRDIIQELGAQMALEKLQEVVESEVLGKALWLLGHEMNHSGQLSMFEQDEASEEWQRLLEAYFFSQTTKSDLRRLGLSRGIDSARDRFHLLGGVVQCLIGLAPTNQIEQHRRIILWIDELEDLIYYTTRHYRPFTQGLRELIDRLPAYFTLMMNFTLASPEALQDIETVLGKAILDRVTHNIYFQEPDEEEAIEYVCELLRLYRTEEPDVRDLPVTYPFEEEALRVLLSDLPTRTPRDINQKCADVVIQALQRGIISAPGVGVIHKEFIQQLESERIDLDLRK